MREAFRIDDGSYVPGVAWVYDGRQIFLGSLTAFAAERAQLEQHVQSALADGYHSDDVWAYWAQQGGQHYLSVRSVPEPLLAPNVQKALEAALASLNTTR